MPAIETVRRLAAQVRSGDHAGAIRDWFAPDASMQENQAPRRRGRGALAAREQARLDRMAHFETQLLAHPLISGGSVVLRSRFTFFLKSGSERSLEEFALPARQGDRIAAETFFYDPARMKD